MPGTTRFKISPTTMTKKDMAKLAEEEIIGTKPQGWAFAMEAEEAISRLKDIHTKAE